MQRIKRIRELRDAANHDGLLSLFRDLPATAQLLPNELVIKGRGIQIGPDDGRFSLEDAEAAFLEALELDPDHVPALLELAWYYHAVQDDSAKALPYFERALELTRDDFTEAARGRSNCLVELVSREAGAEALRQANTNALLLEKLWPDELEMLEGGQEEAEATPLEPR